METFNDIISTQMIVDTRGLDELTIAFQNLEYNNWTSERHKTIEDLLRTTNSRMSSHVKQIYHILEKNRGG